MRILISLILSILTGTFCAYWVWQWEYGWLQVFLAYVAGGSLSLFVCFAIIYVISLGEE